MGHFFPGLLKKLNYYNIFKMSYGKSLANKSSFNIDETKKKFKQMSIEEKRKHYKCRDNYVTIDDIESWKVAATSSSILSSDIKSIEGIYKHDPVLNEKISIYKGDITRLEIDSIVNAANSSLLGGGGVDGAIHEAAGNYLFEECKTLNGCKVGDAKITFGYNLPAKYIIHTVGPKGEKPSYLESCYTSCLNLAVENEVRTIAFPCISTGVYGYPNEAAAKVALGTVRTYLEANNENFDRIIFCLFMDVDIAIYNQLSSLYFPVN